MTSAAARNSGKLVLIIWLDLSGQTRPKTAAECKNVWHLQRVKETK